MLASVTTFLPLIQRLPQFSWGSPLPSAGSSCGAAVPEQIFCWKFKVCIFSPRFCHQHLQVPPVPLRSLFHFQWCLSSGPKLGRVPTWEGHCSSLGAKLKELDYRYKKGQPQRCQCTQSLKPWKPYCSVAPCTAWRHLPSILFNGFVHFQYFSQSHKNRPFYMLYGIFQIFFFFH